MAEVPVTGMIERTCVQPWAGVKLLISAQTVFRPIRRDGRTSNAAIKQEDQPPSSNLRQGIGRRAVRGESVLSVHQREGLHERGQNSAAGDGDAGNTAGVHYEEGWFDA